MWPKHVEHQPFLTRPWNSVTDAAATRGLGSPEFKSYSGMNGGQARARQSDPCWSTQHGAFGWCRNLQCAHAFEVGRRKEMRKLCAWDHGDHAVSCLLYTSCQPANPTLYSGIWIERPLRTTAFLVMRTKRPAVTPLQMRSQASTSWRGKSM